VCVRVCNHSIHSSDCHLGPDVSGIPEDVVVGGHCLFIYPSIHPSTHPPFTFHPSITLPIYPSIHPSTHHPSIHLSIYHLLSIQPTTYHPSVYPSIQPSTHSPPIHLSIHHSPNCTIHLSTHCKNNYKAPDLFWVLFEPPKGWQ
jgi:hypothetical protein